MKWYKDKERPDLGCNCRLAYGVDIHCAMPPCTCFCHSIGSIKRDFSEAINQLGDLFIEVMQQRNEVPQGFLNKQIERLLLRIEELEEQVDRLEDAMGKCVEIDGRLCPIHGECSCDIQPKDKCSLHAFTSNHVHPGVGHHDD